MRFTPYKDCKEYYELPNLWEIKPWFQEPPKKRKTTRRPKEWLEEPTVNIIGLDRCKEIKQNTIPHWRDIEKKKIIKEEDIRFTQWGRNRRKKCEQTKLPQHFPNGLRFIKLTMGFPLGWNCRDMPLDLAGCRDVKKKEREAVKAAKAAAKAKAAADKAKKIADAIQAKRRK